MYITPRITGCYSPVTGGYIFVTVRGESLAARHGRNSSFGQMLSVYSMRLSKLDLVFSKH